MYAQLSNTVPSNSSLISHQSPTILVCGGFSYVSGFDGNTLESILEIPTSPEQKFNFRVSCCVSSSLGAVSQLLLGSHNHSLSSVVTFRLDETRKRICTFANRHHGSIPGLECLQSTSPFGVARIVSGSHCSELFVWNGLSGEELTQLPNAPAKTWRCFSVPKWNLDEVFVGGGIDFYGVPSPVPPASLLRYNVERSLCVGEYQGHFGWVYGLSADENHGILFSCSGTPNLKFWSADDQQCQETIHLRNPGFCLHYDEYQHMLIAGLYDGSVEFWDSRNVSERMGSLKVAQGRLLDVDSVASDVFVAVSAPKQAVLFDSREMSVKCETEMPGSCFGCCVVGIPETGSPGRVEIDSLRSELDELRSHLEEQTNRIEGLVELLERRAGKITELESEKRNEGRRTRELRRQVEEHRNHNQGLTSQVVELRRQNQLLVRASKKQVTELESEKHVLMNQMEEVTARLEDQSRRNSVFLERKREFESEKQRLADELRSKATSVVDLEAMCLVEKERRRRAEASNPAPHVGLILDRISGEDSLRLNPSTAFARRGYLDVGDLLWSVQLKKSRRFCVSFPTEHSRLLRDDDAEAHSNLNAVEILVELETDPALRILVYRLCGIDVDDPELVSPVAEQYSEYYADWVRWCGKGLSPDTVALADQQIRFMQLLVEGLVSEINSSFGGDVDDVLRDEYLRRVTASSSDVPFRLGSLIGAGLGEHRSLVLKLVLDVCGVPCCLMSGHLHEDFRVWTAPRLGDMNYVVDPGLPVSSGGCFVPLPPVGYVPLCLTLSPEEPLVSDIVGLADRYRSLMSSHRPLLEIGRGTFGDVFEMQVSDSSDDWIAVKEIDLEKISARCHLDYRSHLEREWRLLSELHHPNVIKMICMFRMTRIQAVSVAQPSTEPCLDTWNLDVLCGLLHLEPYASRFREEDVILGDLPRILTEEADFLSELIPSKFPRERLVRHVLEHGVVPPSTALLNLCRSCGRDRLHEFLTEHRLSAYGDRFDTKEIVFLDLPHLLADEAEIGTLFDRRGAVSRFLAGARRIRLSSTTPVSPRTTTSASTSREIMCLAMKRYSCCGDRFVLILRDEVFSVNEDAALLEALLMLIQVANGLRYLHSVSLLHLDLKPGNVLIEWDSEEKHVMSVVLCDFGGAKEKRRTYLQTVHVMGTREICAPEVLSGLPFDERADIYSFGCLLLTYSEFFGQFYQLRDVGFRCQFDDPFDRPSLVEIVSILRTHIVELDRIVRRRNKEKSV